MEPTKDCSTLPILRFMYGILEIKPIRFTSDRDVGMARVLYLSHWCSGPGATPVLQHSLARQDSRATSLLLPCAERGRCHALRYVRPMSRPVPPGGNEPFSLDRRQAVSVLAVLWGRICGHTEVESLRRPTPRRRPNDPAVPDYASHVSWRGRRFEKPSSPPRSLMPSTWIAREREEIARATSDHEPVSWTGTSACLSKVFAEAWSVVTSAHSSPAVV